MTSQHTDATRQHTDVSGQYACQVTSTSRPPAPSSVDESLPAELAELGGGAPQVVSYASVE